MESIVRDSNSNIQQVFVTGTFTLVNNFQFNQYIYVEFIPDVIIVEKIDYYTLPATVGIGNNVEGVFKIQSNLINNNTLITFPLATNYLTTRNNVAAPDPLTFTFDPIPSANYINCNNTFLNKSKNQYTNQYSFQLINVDNTIPAADTDIQISLTLKFIKYPDTR